MTRPTVILEGKGSRDKACEWVRKAPPGTTVEFRQNKRTVPQNDRLHAQISRLADQLTWHGQKLSVADWKLIMLDGLKGELRIVPNIQGTGFVNLGRHTSKLTKDEFTQLMDLVDAFAAQHGVDLGED